MPASPPPSVLVDFVQELTKLQSLVQELQHERDELRAERRVARGSRRPQQLAITRPGNGRELSAVMETLMGRVCNEVWPFRSIEFCMRRGRGMASG